MLYLNQNELLFGRGIFFYSSSEAKTFILAIGQISVNYQPASGYHFHWHEDPLRITGGHITFLKFNPWPNRR